MGDDRNRAIAVPAGGHRRVIGKGPSVGVRDGNQRSGQGIGCVARYRAPALVGDSSSTAPTWSRTGAPESIRYAKRVGATYSVTSSRIGGPTACRARIAPTPLGAGSPSRCSTSCTAAGLSNSRFRKRQSGNPRGRPRGSESLARVAHPILNEKIRVRENGERRITSSRPFP